MPSSSLAEFYGGISAAIVIKLTSSIDDVLWLSAFLIPSLSTRQRVRNAATYACVCLLQTILAFVISTFGEEAVDAVMTHQQHSSIQLSTDRILTLIAGAILFVYSIVLGVEYYRENCGEEEKGDYSAIELVEQDEEMIVDEITISEAGGQTHGESTTNEVEGNIEAHMNIDTEQKGTTIDEPSAPPTSDKKSSSLALIAFIGSLDDLTLFVPMLMGKTFGIIKLIIGATTATLAIILICLFVSKCQMVSDVLERIPLVAIVVGFTTFLLVKGIFFMD